MPTYEYHCGACNRSYERREGFDAPATHRCDFCKRGKAKRVLHAPTVVFKGSGFYVNDSKKSETSTSSRSTDKSMSLPSDSSGKSKGKSESKGSGSGKSAKSGSSSSKD